MKTKKTKKRKTSNYTSQTMEKQKIRYPNDEAPSKNTGLIPFTQRSCGSPEFQNFCDPFGRNRVQTRSQTAKNKNIHDSRDQGNQIEKIEDATNPPDKGSDTEDKESELNKSDTEDNRN